MNEKKTALVAGRNRIWIDCKKFTSNTVIVCLYQHICIYERTINKKITTHISEKAHLCKLLWNINRMQWYGCLRLCCHKHLPEYLVRNQSLVHTFWFLGMFFCGKLIILFETVISCERVNKIFKSKYLFRTDTSISISAVAKPGRIYSTAKWWGMFSVTFIRLDDIYPFSFTISPNFTQFIFSLKNEVKDFVLQYCNPPEQTFTRSKSTIGKLENCVNYVQS